MGCPAVRAPWRIRAQHLQPRLLGVPQPTGKGESRHGRARGHGKPGLSGEGKGLGGVKLGMWLKLQVWVQRERGWGAARGREHLAGFAAALGLLAAFKLCLKIPNPILNCSAGMGAHKRRDLHGRSRSHPFKERVLAACKSGKIFPVPWMGSGVSVPSEGRQIWDEHPEPCLGCWEGAATGGWLGLLETVLDLWDLGWKFNCSPTKTCPQGPHPPSNPCR